MLVVEKVAKDGAVATKYIYGANPAWNLRQAGVNQWNGKISGSTLMLRGNNISVDYKWVDGASLSGTFAGQMSQQTAIMRRK